MRRALALLLLASLAHADDRRGRFERFCSRTGQGRTHRGFQCDDLAFFEAFPASGAGTSGACGTTAPTGAKGEALTFSRGSNGTCQKTATGGLVNTGIANGDLVVLSSNVARVEYDSGGVRGLLVELGGTNLNLQSANLADAVYTSIGAPTVTANTTVSPDNTTTMATIQDNSGAAQEGRQQVIVATAGQPYTLSVFVKAGTLSSVTVSLDGTTATCTSLSATTSTRCIVTDASASGVAINAQVLGGTVVGDTGTFIAWGQQVELGSFASSYIPTAAGTATRVADDATMAFTSTLLASGSIAATTWSVTGGLPSNAGWFTVAGPTRTNFRDGFIGFANSFAGSFYSNATQGFANTVVVSAGTNRMAGFWGAAGTGWLVNGSGATGAGVSDTVAVSWFNLMNYNGSGTNIHGIISRVCLDPSPARCR